MVRLVVIADGIQKERQIPENLAEIILNICDDKVLQGFIKDTFEEMANLKFYNEDEELFFEDTDPSNLN